MSYQHGAQAWVCRFLVPWRSCWGQLNLHSREGEGATFTIAPPLAVRGVSGTSFGSVGSASLACCKPGPRSGRRAESAPDASHNHP